MDASVYEQILDEIMLPYSSYHVPPVWVFHQDNDKTHQQNGKEVVQRELSQCDGAVCTIPGFELHRKSVDEHKERSICTTKQYCRPLESRAENLAFHYG
ncbi:hypothetical protein DOY81_009779 [Sarcophaga bullata]|nr:hypothetical protein DOY81_009779 [Sarcophaga bullata]